MPDPTKPGPYPDAMDRAVRTAICAAICRKEARRLYRRAQALTRAAERYTQLNRLMCERALKETPR